MGVTDFSKMTDEELIQIASGGGSLKKPSTQMDFSKMSDDELMAIATSSNPSNKTSGADATLQGFGRAVSVGYLPEMQAATATLLTPRDENTPIKPSTLSMGKFPRMIRANEKELYEKNLASFQARQEQLEKDHPYLTGGGMLAGGLASAIATQPLMAIGALPKVAAGGGKLLQAGRTALEAARQGAIFGAITKPEGEDTPEARYENMKTGAKWSAGLGLGFEVLGRAIPLLKNGIKYGSEKAVQGGKYAMSALFGPKTEVIERYLQRADMIKNAKSVEEIKNVLDSTVQVLFDDVDNSKVTRDEAKEILKSISDEIKDTAKEAGFNFRVKKADLYNVVKETTKSLDDAFSSKKSMLENIKSPIQLSDDVATAIQDLKNQIKEGSAQSYKILENDRNAYSVRNAAPLLRKMADEMNIQPFSKGSGGDLSVVGASRGGPVTPETAAIQNQLRSFAERLENTPELVPAKELKKILQQIDSSEKAMYGQPGFDSRISQAYKFIRSTIDQAVKDANPAYRQKMEEIAPKMELLSNALERFGDQRSTIAKLNTIASRTAGEDRALLERLGKVTNFNFSEPIASYTQAQSVLKDPRAMESLKTSLPEFESMMKAKNDYSRIMRPEEQSNFVKSQIESSGLMERLSNAQSGLSDAVKKLQSSEANLKPFKSLGPHSTQNAIKGLMKDPGKESIELRRTIKKLSDMSGKDFENWISDRAAADAFKGEFRLGSRNVNLWAMFGLVTGGGPGAGVGASVGALVDRFGPQMAQKTLDAVLKIKGSPTLFKIESMALPKEVISYLKSTLPRAAAITETVKDNSALTRRLQLLRSAEENDN